ncbi:aspartate aminotransferase family protein [Martelella endophytica]|uniref:4-aminobutyrate aminotransferase n=1 Tax=Martelella endophytica TaxID=1486262 RepID=A0A0D5LNJ0_MAREN|nr:aspartate aminotransferase family protein [Martelella endophytica]AJY45706.1 4-aminobutyrate aminotransferase [Martelella endophytica]
MSSHTGILAHNRFDPDKAGELDVALAERVKKRNATFGPASVLFYEEPIEAIRAEGAYMIDAKGRRYLDTYNNVPSVGHCHPHVAEAVARQSALLTTNTRYLVRVVEDYSERLLATFPARLSNIVFTCTGSEANDIAMRIARNATGKQGFVVTEAAYHGNTALVTEISPDVSRDRKPAPFVRTIPAPSLSQAPGGDVATSFTTALKAAIADLEGEGYGCAAFIADSIFSSDGIHADPAGFLKPAVEAVHAAGGLYIADEVQPGMGRTGGGLWGFMRHEIEPDIVTMGKPLGNGFPMAACVTRPALLGAFCADTNYFNTFGGNPVAAAAGMAALDVIENEGLIENARLTGGAFTDALRNLMPRHPRIGEVRGAGLFFGVDIVDPETGAADQPTTRKVINRMKEAGVLLGSAGRDANTLKVRPPLTFTEAQSAFFVEALDGVLQRI